MSERHDSKQTLDTLINEEALLLAKSANYGQGERIARMIHLLVTKGGQSYPELEKRFPKCKPLTIHRDIKLLKKTGLIVEKRKQKTMGQVISRKVFIFFKDNRDVVGKTKDAMENLKQEYSQVTLDLIACHAGFPPEEIRVAAYNLAPQLDLLIGKEEKQKPPSPLVVGKK